MQRRFIHFLSIAAAMLLLSSCSSSATPTATTKAPPSTPASAGLSKDKELRLVREIRPVLAEVVDKLKANDLSGAKKTWDRYDPLWNGMEIYINYRSLPTYQDLETNWQAKINAAFAAPSPSVSEILPMAQAILAKWDEAMKIVESGPSISPLFDDIADVRTARQPLRRVGPALTAKDLTAARAAWQEFTANWPQVQKFFQARSPEATQELVTAISAVNAAWQKTGVTIEEITPLAATVTNRYGYGQNLLTSAARKADATKTAYAEADAVAAGHIRGIQAELRASLASWNSGNYQDAGARSAKAAVDRFNASALATPLKAKSLDVALKTPLDAYAALAGVGGDAAKVAAANKSAIESGEIAVQGLVGQFWPDPKLQQAIIAATPK